MIRSKPGFLSLAGQYTMPVLLVFFLSIFYPVFLRKNHVELFSMIGLLCFVITVVFPVYIIAQMKINYKRILIDTSSKTITFKMYILPISKTYDLDYFDGYMEAIMQRDYYVGTYKCYYLVKDNKLKYKISGRFYRNIDELREGISLLPYLGSIKHTLSLSINIALGEEVLTD